MISLKKISNGVYAIKYSNGETIVVNYKDIPYIYNGETVAPKDFKLIKQSFVKKITHFFKGIFN